MIHVLYLKVTSAIIKHIMSHVKPCKHYSNVIITRQTIDRHVTSVMIFYVRVWIDIVCYIILAYFMH